MFKYLTALLLMGGLGFAQADDIAELEKQTAAGDKNAMCDLGNRLLRGRGVDTDGQRGIKLVQQAANAGSADCQYDLGLMFKDGRWMPLDAAQAVTWFSRAAEQNHASAQLELGLAYSEGNGVEKAEGRALGWLKRAAAQKNSSAMHIYGRALLTEQRAVGLAWLHLAAELGNMDAQTLLAGSSARDIAENKAVDAALKQLRQELARP